MREALGLPINEAMFPVPTLQFLVFADHADADERDRCRARQCDDMRDQLLPVAAPPPFGQNG